VKCFERITDDIYHEKIWLTELIFARYSWHPAVKLQTYYQFSSNLDFK